MTGVYSEVYQKVYRVSKHPTQRASTPGGDATPPLTWAFVVRPLGFEPRTCGLRVRCSAIELEAQLPGLHTARPGKALFRVTEGIRTPDFRDHNAAL